MKKLYFKVNRKNGYSLQLVVDLDRKTVKCGYCLAIMQDFTTLKSIAELHKLKNNFVACGFVEVE